MEYLLSTCCARHCCELEGRRLNSALPPSKLTPVPQDWNFRDERSLVGAQLQLTGYQGKSRAGPGFLFPSYLVGRSRSILLPELRGPAKTHGEHNQEQMRQGSQVEAPGCQASRMHPSLGDDQVLQSPFSVYLGVLWRCCERPVGS